MEHPIQGLMDTAMSNIKAMVDVDTVVGDAVTAPDGTIIIPISTVSFGFGAGGSEFGAKKDTPVKDTMFGGGCGGGASVKPAGFLVVNSGNVRYLPLNSPSSPIDKIIDLVPEMVDKLNKVMEKRKKEKKQEEKQAECVDAIIIETDAPEEEISD